MPVVVEGDVVEVAMKLDYLVWYHLDERHAVMSKCDLLLPILFHLQESEGVQLRIVYRQIVSLKGRLNKFKMKK